MAALPIITDGYLARMTWTNASAPRTASTSMHFLDTSGASTPAALATAIDAQVTANMWELVSSSSTVTQLLITPLDGISATYTLTIAGAPAKWSGSGGTDLILQGAVVVSFKSANRGKQWRNRTYLPWVGETGQSNGTLTPANVANMQTGWTAFLAAMTASTIWDPIVVSPSLSSYSTTTQAVVRPYLRTQRRRVRR